MTRELEKLARRDSRKAGKALSHKDALNRIAAKSVEISTFLDVGAARGAWSLLAERCWPRAHYHLLEAKDVWRADLEKLCARKDHFSFTMKAVSDQEGEIFFPKGGEAYAGAAFKDPSTRDDLVATPAATIDGEVAGRELQGPYGIKLDTHGTEIDILNGAQKTLEQTNLICIETYNFIGQKRFPEMLIHLQSLGFQTADISGPLFRPTDASLWQLDFYLLRRDHPTFQQRGFA